MTRYLRRLAPVGGFCSGSRRRDFSIARWRDHRLPERHHASEPVLHECKADGDHGRRVGREGDLDDAERRGRCDRHGWRSDAVVLQVWDVDVVWQADADANPWIVSAWARLPILHDARDAGGVGECIGANTLYDVRLPDLREQFRYDEPGRWWRQTFKTKFQKPIKNFKTPAKVKHNKKFKVKFTLNFNAKVVKIFLKRKNGSILKTFDYGSQKAGNHTKTIKAPKKKGQYTVEVHAKLSCGSQSIKHKLKVH